jgi:bleomycin hydrolase
MQRDVEWQRRREKDPQRRMYQNIISSSPLDTVFFNRSKWNKTEENPTFTEQLLPKNPEPVTDQKRSGRCWVFAVLNMMRIPFMRRYRLESFRFSANYVWFWAKYESSLFFLHFVRKKRKEFLDKNSYERRMWLGTIISDGGTFVNAQNIIEKYGIVPYSFHKETTHSTDTDELIYILNRKLHAMAHMILEEERWEIKTWSRDIFECLAMFLGSPPLGCSFQDKEYTPFDFYRKKVLSAINLSTFGMIGNDPRHSYHHRYGHPDNGHVWEAERESFVNVSWKEMVEQIRKTIRTKKMPVYITCAVSESYFSNIPFLDFDLEHNFILSDMLDKKSRLDMYDISLSHAMVIVGYDAKKGIWKVENSWGKVENTQEEDLPHFFTITDAWLEANLFKAAIPKSLIPSCPKKIQLLPLFDTMV